MSDGKPDFSGLWAHPGLGFGPQLSGPGPIRNKSRLPSGASNFDQLVGDYSNPILKPEAAEVVKKLGEISLSGFCGPGVAALQSGGRDRGPTQAPLGERSPAAIATRIEQRRPMLFGSGYGGALGGG